MILFASYSLLIYLKPPLTTTTTIIPYPIFTFMDSTTTITLNEKTFYSLSPTQALNHPTHI